MGERVVDLDKVGSCLGCGVKEDRVLVDRDHFIPRVVGRIETSSPEIVNPYASLIFTSENMFKLCREICHEGIERKKQQALFSTSSRKVYTPDLMMAVLCAEYPITANHRFYSSQLMRIAEICEDFAIISELLEQEFDPELVDSFKRAGEIAERHATRLQGLLSEYRRTEYID